MLAVDHGGDGSHRDRWSAGLAPQDGDQREGAHEHQPGDDQDTGFTSRGRDWLVLVPGAVGRGVAPEPDPDEAVGAGVAAGMMLLVILVEQMTRAPPPFAEPLHWLIVTPRDEGSVPVAVHSRRTRVPGRLPSWDSGGPV